MCPSKTRHTHETGPIVREHVQEKSERGVEGVPPRAAREKPAGRAASDPSPPPFVSPQSSFGNCPQDKREPPQATLQIHEAEEPPQLGICMIITGRGSHLSSLPTGRGDHRDTGPDWRDKWGGGSFLIFINSVAFSSKRGGERLCLVLVSYHQLERERLGDGDPCLLCLPRSPALYYAFPRARLNLYSGWQ